jgi:para-nitrobenzyl esterase
MVTLELEAGYISGTTIGEAGQGIDIYRGIPYAAPPVSSLRWKPPQPVAPWSGIRECTVFSLQPTQLPDVNMPEEEQKEPSSEDCLYLNVLTPAKKDTGKLPVMVWFHGGALRYGNGNKLIYNSTGLPRQGVVLVTVNTRLGVLGLLPHRLLTKESPEHVSGNYLLLDMVASLQWVKKNIAAFGGDPDNVTIFGQSGGCHKVLSLMASPLAKGLFHRAIGQSEGTGPGPTTMADMEGFGNDLFCMLGVDKGKDPLAASRAIPWQKIIEVDQALSVEQGKKYGSWFAITGLWNLSVDKYSIPDFLPDIFKTGKQNPVPFILSSTLGELTGPGLVVMPQLIPDYIGLLAGANRINSKAYACIFDQIPGNWKQEGMVSAHAMELHYVFGVLDDPAAWNSHLTIYAASGAKSCRPLITDTDRNVSEMMMKIWTQFARTGNPNITGLVTWPAWRKESDKYLYINNRIQVKSGYSRIAQQAQ